MGENKIEKRNDWSEYIEKTKDKPPKPGLIEAMSFVDAKNEALDLGPGAFNDTKFLLSEGFEHVTAVDKSDAAQEIYNQLPKDKVEYIISSFEDFDFPENKFDMVNAQFSLPFNPPDTFDEVFDKIQDSLKEKGIFVGQFFGEKHGWNVEGTRKTFRTKEDAEKLLSDMEIIKLEEEEKDEKPVVGELVHWHIFHIIARKKSDN